MNKLVPVIISFSLLALVFLQSCISDPTVEVLSEEDALVILKSHFGDIDQFAVYDGKTINDYTSRRTVIHFQLAEDMAAEDWLTFLVQSYADTHSNDSGYVPFYSVNNLQYKNDVNGKGGEITTLSYTKNTRLYEYDLYIYY